MKVKMVKYFLGNPSQVFATFEYQKLRFDMQKDLSAFPSKWDFLKDESFNKIKKIINLDALKRSCEKDLNLIDNHVL